jgi:hypothetical protein
LNFHHKKLFLCIRTEKRKKNSSLLPIFSCSVKTDLMEIGANSTILVAKVNKTDSGNYSCSIGESQQYTVLVHVLNGKNESLIAF